ncbi:hypothetical protein SMACR_07715 [Sordaria macrospora]|uniref:WGS project CABT00000000 data, contig 2.27 n=2 Tax=Sordaria macrospora TaxID=5147 RepID=F7W4D4_SORMK|nr:uncharacterized protein SMAC_07715 [Sordaria macrospora k-hell]KAA8634903.1 hypothetical protein SMACR_07715 [Sordaria macrospora]KAH7635454.1 hypothetical protein B0T09DRAFT_379249 [Sordaria sp. MPI-SDFR-AT-0083]WPJ67386.1 hypothetical protein SMAC4_07715 [Sordaria macrospora]CCC14887.1 unnamed protein product [Sordaria macrospora k-hell]
MRTFTLLGSLLALVSVHVVKAADYGPCPYKENENCWEIMDNTGCFLNPTSTEQIFGCITGGKEGQLPPFFYLSFDDDKEGLDDDGDALDEDG